MVDWSKFDKEIDIEGMKNDIMNAKDNKRTKVEIPVGEYDVVVDNIECKESKNGEPMVVIKFKIVDGPYKNYSLWLNQVITKGFQIHLVNELLRGFVQLIDMDIEWTSYEQYEELLAEVLDEITNDFEYTIDYKLNGTFPAYKVLEVHEL